jgi:hypothetical protein
MYQAPPASPVRSNATMAMVTIAAGRAYQRERWRRPAAPLPLPTRWAVFRSEATCIGLPQFEQNALPSGTEAPQRTHVTSMDG